jgi:hypothetical protein
MEDGVRKKDDGIEKERLKNNGYTVSFWPISVWSDPDFQNELGIFLNEFISCDSMGP